MRIRILLGCSIENACERAVNIAIEHGRPVEFDFNGVAMSAAPDNQPSELVEFWHNEMDRRQADWLASPEHAASEIARQEKIASTQEHVNALVAQLPALLADQSALVDWCGEYTEAQDMTGVDGQRLRVVDLLTYAGYKSNDCVEHPNITRPNIFARWLIGQVIAGATDGGIIYPGLKRFARDYHDLTAEP